jgi:hypothetical protein
MAHESGVDDRDALVLRDPREECLGVTGVGGDPHVEAEGPKIALERRSGYRLTGEDGGRQTNSLPEARRVRTPVMCVVWDIPGAGPGGMSAEGIGRLEACVHWPFMD